MTLYALYKGDALLALGTRHEIAAKMGVRADTISFMAAPSYRRVHQEGIRRGTVRYAERVI